ncbi:hypothetical protein GBA52_005579 [Prunus armeniaca]|nr:hypothetical protein GBA52_005579 [Prunus armeniaca]
MNEIDAYIPIPYVKAKSCRERSTRQNFIGQDQNLLGKIYCGELCPKHLPVKEMLSEEQYSPAKHCRERSKFTGKGLPVEHV